MGVTPFVPTEVLWFKVTAFVAIFFLGVLGNLLVIYVFRSKQNDESSKTSPMELLIIYLAWVDLIASVVNPPLYIYWILTYSKEWVFGHVLCKVIPSITALSVTMSLGLIVLITIERCHFMRHPFDRKEFTKRHVHWMVLVVFIISVLTEFTYIYHLQVTRSWDVYYDCKQIPFKQIEVSSFGGNNTATSIATTTTPYQVTKTITNMKQCPPLNSIDYSYNKTISTETYKSCTYLKCKEIKQCVAESSLEYQISRVATVLFRDILFVVTFMICNLLVYHTLKDEEHDTFLHGQSTIHPTKTIKITIMMSIIFAILVLPKDIFLVIYTVKRISGSHMMSYQYASVINSMLKVLQSFNSVVNVFIYAKLHRSFKQCLINTLPYPIKHLMMHSGDQQQDIPAVRDAYGVDQLPTQKRMSTTINDPYEMSKTNS